jgi:ribosomal protein S18 acetylase RimI-like enzyme
MSITFRPATTADALAVVPLIYSSGPDAFDYVFEVPGRASATEFLHLAFLDGRGEFGYQNHVVGTVAGQVVAAGAAWSGAAALQFTIAAARQILGCYGPIAGAGTMVRGLRVESIIQPTRKGCWYVAHLGVPPTLRGRGYGRSLLARLLETGRPAGYARAALDVAVTNPRAEALYRQLGFTMTTERVSTLRNSQATVANHRRMELTLAALPRDAR